MSFAILGLGTAVPALTITKEEGVRIAEEICRPTEEQAAWLRTTYDHTGIEQRHLAFPPRGLVDLMQKTRVSRSVFLPGESGERGPTTGQRMQHYAENAAPLALQAAGEALSRSGLVAGEVTHLVTVSCTGFWSPGLDYELITGLGLPSDTQRTHIGFMGCNAALNALRVARAFTGADAEACVLLCAVELCGAHFHYGWDAEKAIANALFADGAAAAIGASAGRAPAGAWCVAADGCCLLPNSREDMGWTIGDYGFEMRLSRRVPALIARYLRPWMERWLGENGLAIGDVGSWAVHPGGPRILEGVEEALGLPPQATAAAHEVLATHGNMSSPTVLFILDRLLERRAPRPCVALAFGPGLTIEAVLFR
jgi:predicted naringenin-chalcone synthase